MKHKHQPHLKKRNKIKIHSLNQRSKYKKYSGSYIATSNFPENSSTSEAKHADICFHSGWTCFPILFPSHKRKLSQLSSSHSSEMLYDRNRWSIWEIYPSKFHLLHELLVKFNKLKFKMNGTVQGAVIAALYNPFLFVFVGFINTWLIQNKHSIRQGYYWDTVTNEWTNQKI